MADIVCRRMAMKDIVQIVNLEKVCFPTPWSPNAFYQELENPQARYLVLDNEERIVAYGGMWLIIDEAHVTNVAVAPEFRNRGFGKQIMGEMFRLAFSEGINKMTLEVRPSNTNALKLYYGFGFVPAGVRKKYYSNNGEDALILWNDDIAKHLPE